MPEAPLTAVSEDLWIHSRPLRFLGVETGTRMTLIRLASGGLFVHSPVALDRTLREAVDALGPVVAIVAPSLFHHLWVADWARAYPDALLCACPGLEKKRTDLNWDRVLGDEPEEAWRGEIDQVFFGARSLENEVVFFHRRSGTLVCADMVFNLATHPSRLTRFVAFLLGNRRPGATLLERLILRDRVAAREQLDRMLAWKADRIVISHGDIVESDGAETLRRAYAWV